MISKRLQKLTPYIAGEQPKNQDFIKLNTNENPFSPSPMIGEFLRNLNIDKLRLYPDPDFTELREILAGKYHLNKNNFIMSNGSDEILSFIFYAFFDSDYGDLLFPEHTFSFYPVFSDFHGIKYKKIGLETDFSINFDHYIQTAKQSCGIIFANPNAPTGIYENIEKIKYLLEHYPSDKIVVVDEAYISFGGTSAISMINQYPNLVITRTFSKSESLAGTRIGYAAANPDLINSLFVVKNSFNSYTVNYLSQEIAKIALLDDEYYQKISKKIIDIRENTIQQMKSLNWRVLPSKTNFIFAAKKGFTGKEIYTLLRSNGFLVRYFDIEGIQDFVRITIGAKNQMNQLIQTLKKLFS